MVECEGVREYSEELPVRLDVNEDNSRVVIIAENEGGNNCTQVDLIDLLQWLEKEIPRSRCPHCGAESTVATRKEGLCWHCGNTWNGII